MAWSLRGHTRRACRILVRIVYYSTGSVAPLNIWNESGVGATFYVTVLGVGIFRGRNVEYCTTMNNVHKHTKLIFHTILQKKLQLWSNIGIHSVPYTRTIFNK